MGDWEIPQPDQILHQRGSSTGAEMRESVEWAWACAATSAHSRASSYYVLVYENYKPNGVDVVALDSTIIQRRGAEYGMFTQLRHYSRARAVIQ